MRRVNAALREVLAEAVGRELSDPRLGFVTITEVQATRDLREATVLYTTLAAEEREPSRDALESARGVLQARVADQLQSRNTPHLRFVYDEHLDRARSISRLIDEVTADLPPADAPPRGDG